MQLIRNFYHWLPIGAFVFIDEVQDVYVKGRKEFNPADYDYKGVGHWNDKLKPHIIERYNDAADYVRCNINPNQSRTVGEFFPQLSLQALYAF